MRTKDLAQFRYDGYFPTWLNHLMHTTVLPLQLGEMFFCRHEYPNRVVGGGINTLLTLLYLGWVHVIYYYGGFWVYPVFKALNPQVRPVFMAACCAMGGSFYILGEKMNALLWERNSEPKLIDKNRQKRRKDI